MPRPRGREWGDGWGRFSYIVLCVLREQSLGGGEWARWLCKLRRLIGRSQPRPRCRGELRGGVPPASRPAGWPLAGRAAASSRTPRPLTQAEGGERPSFPRSCASGVSSSSPPPARPALCPWSPARDRGPGRSWRFLSTRPGLRPGAR